MPQQQNPKSPGLLVRLLFYGMAIGLAAVHVFITFRGVSSATGMEHAQMAREIARGHVLHTKVVRPYAWKQLAEAGRATGFAELRDTSQPPLQALVWAPLFKLLEKHHAYAPGKNSTIYLLDRAIACVGALGFLLTILWTHGLARRLFDETVAAVVALALMLCEPLWQTAVSGSPAALLLPLFALAMRVFVAACGERVSALRLTMSMLFTGALCALMIMTHWLALWLTVGFTAAAALSLPRQNWQAALVLLFPAAALTTWSLWMMQVCGDPMGAAKTVFQAHLQTSDVQALQRQFSLALPPVAFDALPRKLGLNLLDQTGRLYEHLASLLPALLFFPALLHRFRSREALASGRGLGIIFLALMVGLGLVGLPDGPLDDAALFAVLAPAMSAYGTAMLAVLWTRLKAGGGWFWTAQGYAVLALAISALPMVVQLPTYLKAGLTMKEKFFPHWPPYLPERVAILRRLLEDGEVVFSDAPWFVAWYADVPAVWLPNKRSDFAPMREQLERDGGASVGGVVMTPVSARVNYLADVFTGAYSDWPDLIYRGPMIAFDREFVPTPEFPYNVAVPLVATPVGSKENLSLLMTFYTDRPRTPRN